MVSRFTTKRIERAEKKARRKIEKYEKRGIHISGKQSPIQSKLTRKLKDTSEVEARHYLKALKEFNSSSSKFIRGKDGAAIPENMYREYKKLESELRPKYTKWWEEHRGERTIHGGKETDQTVGTEAWMIDSDKKYPYGKTFRTKDITEFEGEDDLNKEIELMRKQLDPDYERVKAESVRENMKEAAKWFQESWLEELLDTLDADEIIELNYRTNLVEEFFLAYNIVKSELMTVTEIYEYNNLLEHIYNTVKMVSKNDIGEFEDVISYVDIDGLDIDFNDYYDI